MLVPAVAWAADLGVSYAVVKWTCNHNGALLLYAITLCALVMIAVMLATDKLLFDTLARRLGAWR